MTRAAALALLLAAAAALPGCGGSEGELRISAASSLKTALTAYGEESGARFSFAGSDELAAQIRRGAKPDVFASANTKLPEQLYRAGLVERPVVFAVNRLVLAVPAGSRRVGSLDDLRRPGTALAVGAESVPIGAYTREVLSRLPEAESSAIVANVRSEEPDVSGIVGKLTQGAVDAGLVYASDVHAAGGRLRAVALPDSLQPQVTYGAAIVKGAEHGEEAKAFVDGLLAGPGRRALEAAGFEPPPDATQ